MKKKSFVVGLSMSMLLAFAANFLSHNANATDPVKIPCYASHYVQPGWTYTKCSDCSQTEGRGEDLGQCGPAD